MAFNLQERLQNLQSGFQNIGLLAKPFDIEAMARSLESVPENKIALLQQLMGQQQQQQMRSPTMGDYGMGGFGSLLGPMSGSFGGPMNIYGAEPFGGYMPQEAALLQQQQGGGGGLTAPDENAPWYRKGAFYGGQALQQASPFLAMGLGGLSGPLAPLAGGIAGGLGSGLGSLLHQFGASSQPSPFLENLPGQAKAGLNYLGGEAGRFGGNLAGNLGGMLSGLGNPLARLTNPLGRGMYQ